MSKNDAALLERWIDGRDAEAFSELVHRHAGMVLATSRRILGNASDAEEVTQECFLQASQATRTIVPSLGGWLHRVATNRALDRRRSDTRRAAREEVYAQERPTATEPTWRDIQEHIDDVIAQLPDDLQVPLVLHFFEGRTHREVAKSLGLSRSAVTGRIQRAIATIREELDARHVTLSVAALTGLFAAYEAPAASPALLERLHKIGLADRQAPRAQRSRWYGRLAVPAVVLAVAILWVGGAQLLSRQGDAVTRHNLPVAQHRLPEAPIEEVAPVSQRVEKLAPPEVISVAAAVVAQEAPAEDMLRLQCVDSKGKPVAGAEVYHVRTVSRVPDMMQPHKPGDIIRKPFGPVTTDEDGFVEVPDVGGATGSVKTYYAAYARVPDKLVGAWMHSERSAKDDGWDRITLVPSCTLRGVVTVPPGFDVTTVTLNVLTVRIQTGDIGYGTSFSAASKYRPPLWPEVFSTTPAADGTFQLGDVPKGQTCYLEFTGPGLGESQYRTFDASHDEAITVAMAPESTFSGTVRFVDGAPAVDYPVFARPFGRETGLGVTTSFTALTDAFGRYTISGLPGGRYSLKLQHYGSPPEWISSVVAGVDVAAASAYNDADFLVEKGALQTGRVLDEETGSPISGVGLAVMNPREDDFDFQAQLIGSTETDETGKFAFRVPTGDSYLYVYKSPEEYIYPEDQGKTFISVLSGESVKTALTLTLAAKSAAAREPVGKGTLEGRVVNGRGEGVEGVPIQLGRKYRHGENDRQEQSPSQPTDEAGRFALTVPAQGEYQLVVGGNRFSRVSSEWVAVVADATESFGDIVVEEYTQSISVAVLNYEVVPGMSPPYVRVYHGETDEAIADGPVGQDGRVTFYVPEAPLKIGVSREGFKRFEAAIEPGYEIEVELEPAE